MNFHYALQSKAGQDIHTKKYIFKEFSLLLKNHTKIALTGASGSGKSTLFKLLRGLYKPESILLKMDSKEFNNLKPLTPLVTLVPQLQDIFENTIRYNITLGSDVDENELETIAYTAGIKPLLRRLKKGLDTDLREKGINLSGGERQRIALARGLLAARNSSILLLDEVTSNIDMQTENRIYKRIFELYKDRCLIVSVHRLYLLKIFDTVIALD